MNINEKLLAGRFSIIQCLGHGGMSAVYLVRDHLLDKECALKLIHPHLVSESVLLDRFKREVAISRTVQHPGIIRIYDFFENAEEGQAFLTMEYLAGGALRTRILEQGTLLPAEIIRIGKEALSALESAHKKGIIHRDIKPHNLLFTGDGGLKLVDFGLAQTVFLDGLSTLTQLAGTPEYCAPEIVESGYADSRSDLYSLGITLYEAATGKLPFIANSPYQTLQLQVEAVPIAPAALNNRIPPGLSDVILKAMQKEPGERFQTAAEFRIALDTLEIRKQVFIPETYACPQCGKTLSTVFPYCFYCSSAILQLRTVRKKGYGILITGPGKTGEKFSSEKRYQCLQLVKSSPVSCLILEKQIPRLPFYLINKLDKESAYNLAVKLKAAGIDNIITGPGLKPEKKQAGKIINKKVFTMYPRILLVMLGSTGGLWSQLFKGAPVLLALLALFILGIPFILALGYRRSQIRWNKKLPVSHIPVLLSLAQKVKKPAFQVIIRRLAEKSVFLENRIAGETGLTLKEKSELSLGLETLVQSAVDFISRAEELDQQLSSESELSIYRKIAALEKEIAAGTGIRQSAQWMDNKRILESELETRRRIEQTVSRLLDCLLRFSSQLDNLIINLASLSTVKAGALLPGLEHLVKELESETAAAAELEGEVY